MGIKCAPYKQLTAFQSQQQIVYLPRGINEMAFTKLQMLTANGFFKAFNYVLSPCREERRYPVLTYCVGLALLLPALCQSQNQPDPLYFDQLTISNGLSHNSVYDILQDQQGYIWIGTQNGLNKYDGYDLEIYRSGERGDLNIGFVGKAISSLLEDRAGNLWVGTRKNGINFKPRLSDRFVNLQSDTAFAAIKGYDISSLFEDKSGNIWITTVNAGVVKYDPLTRVSRLYNQENSGLSSNLVFDVVEDKYGTIWVGTAGGGLNYLVGEDKFALSHEMLPNHPNMGSYRKKFFLDDEYLWVGTEGTGLYKMNIRDRTYEHFAPGNENRDIGSNVIKDIYKAKDGRVFIATDGSGLNIYDTSTGEMSTLTYKLEQKNALNSNALTSFLEDRTGNIWMGTYNGGINIYKPNKTWFEHLLPAADQQDGLEQRSVLAICQDHNGKIWVGTDGGGLSSLDSQTGQFSTTSLRNDPLTAGSLAGNVVKVIYEDSQQRMWVGIFGAGLELFDAQAQTFQPVLSGTASIWSIAESSNKDLWVATMGEGLSVIPASPKQLTTFRHNPADPNSLADDNVMNVFVDDRDRVWVGTAYNGLDLWQEAGERFVHHQYDPQDLFSISDNEIRAIFQDSRGALWIGTEGGGLNRWLGEGRFERITQRDGLIANSVMGITEDADGMIWVTTFEGISRLDPVTMAIRNFDFRSTQNANQFNQAAILTATDGKLYFGGINGLNAIRPELVREDRQASDVIFTGLAIYNEPVPVGKLPNGRTVLDCPLEEANLVQLSYLDKAFSVAFSAVDYTNPEARKFTYKMEGFDKDWRSTDAGQHRVGYTNLAPGTYDFQVKYLQQTTSITIDIKPPFWQTLWFRLLLSTSLLALTWYGIAFLISRREADHKRQILELQNEKLATEVDAKTSKLMFSAVQMAHKNEILTGIKQDLQHLNEGPETKMRQLVRKLDQELMSEDYWDEFNLYFNQINQDFARAILEQHPDLTQNDLRMCSLMRINLSTKEIASLLNISTRGVEKSRSRLKKRLGLLRKDDLVKYVTLFGKEGT
jgi:ligand-binding sensor domain-containing protein/DNA-binding CsgD family transcriptional regulator